MDSCGQSLNQLTVEVVKEQPLDKQPLDKQASSNAPPHLSPYASYMGGENNFATSAVLPPGYGVTRLLNSSLASINEVLGRGSGDRSPLPLSEFWKKVHQLIAEGLVHESIIELVQATEPHYKEKGTTISICVPMLAYCCSIPTCQTCHNYSVFAKRDVRTISPTSTAIVYMQSAKPGTRGQTIGELRYCQFFDPEIMYGGYIGNYPFALFIHGRAYPLLLNETLVPVEEYEQEAKTSYGPPPCRYGADCYMQACSFSHPEGWNPTKGVQMQVKGPEIKKTQTKSLSKHQPQSKSKPPSKGSQTQSQRPSETPCRSGLDCKRSGCPYIHSAPISSLISPNPTAQKKRPKAKVPGPAPAPAPAKKPSLQKKNETYHIKLVSAEGSVNDTRT